MLSDYGTAHANRGTLALYGQRSSVAEWSNAEFRNGGLQKFRVRRLEKVRTVTLPYVIRFACRPMLDLSCVSAAG
jgi:hypothetical protein